MLFEIRNGTVSQNGQVVLSLFNFQIRGTEKIAVVGRNGAGKSTLLSVIAGEKELDPDEKHPEAGLFRARRFTVGVLRQQAVTNPEQTVEECILEGVLGRADGGTNDGRGKDTKPEMNSGKGKDDNHFQDKELNKKIDSVSQVYSRERFDYEQRYDRILTELGFSLEDKKKKLGEFSGGEQTKIMLIRLLLEEPEVLILDEPTNHLDLDSVMWLEDYLKRYPKAVVMVSHDRYFIDQTADVVWEVSGGKLTEYAGNYTDYRNARAVQRGKEQKAWEAQQAEIDRLNGLIKKFRNKPRKASFARSREKILERMEKMPQPDEEGAVIHAGDIQPARPGDKWVFQCEDLVIGYPANKRLSDPEIPLRKLSFRIRRGQKIGIFGPNGTGKSTFLKTVAGLISPLSGKLQIGEHVDLAYFAQLTGDQMFPLQNNAESVHLKQLKVIDWFCMQFPVMNPGDVRKYLAGFLFHGEDMGKMVWNLSGGEKARLALAALLADHPNFLVLDEPTNNMDIPAIEALESILKRYQGTILFVSHDRYFLSQVADALLIFEPGTQEVQYYPSDFAHYADRKKRIENGQDVSILRSAENQRLIEDLRAVPENEKGMLRQIPLSEQQFEWEYERNREEREAAEKSFAELAEMERKMSEFILLNQWKNIVQSNNTNGAQSKKTGTAEAEWDVKYRNLQDNMESARDAWTKKCLAWYDIWLEQHGEG